jgi:hypothetical protein
MTRASLVTVTLAVKIGGRARWRKLPLSYGFAAAKGLSRRHLRGGTTLAPGVYRLTVTPGGGAARSLLLRVL